MMKILLVLYGFLFTFPHRVLCAPSGENLELAALLIKDEQYEQARQLLAQIDVAQTSDLATYYQLQGMVKMHLHNYAEAIGDFNASFQQGQTNLLIHLYLAQAYLALEQLPHVLEHLSRSGAIGKQLPLFYVLSDQCYQKMGQWTQALAILQKGLEIFPTNFQIHQSLIGFYLRQGLVQSALHSSAQFLKQYNSPANYLQVAQIFQQNKDLPSAILILEQGKLSHPGNENLVLALVQIYYQLKKPGIAGQILEQWALLHPQFYPEVAELYQLANKHDYALYLNGRVLDEKKKFQQRFGFLLAQERFEQITQLENIWQKHLVLSSDESKYALAYSFFKIGKFNKMEQYLSEISQEELFLKALQMRKSAELCQEQAWACF